MKRIGYVLLLVVLAPFIVLLWALRGGWDGFFAVFEEIVGEIDC